jgi:hypothetical protein
MLHLDARVRAAQGFVKDRRTAVGTFPAASVEELVAGATSPTAAAVAAATTPTTVDCADIPLPETPTRGRALSLRSHESIRSITVPSAERMIVAGKLSSMFRVRTRAATHPPTVVALTVLVATVADALADAA